MFNQKPEDSSAGCFFFPNAFLTAGGIFFPAGFICKKDMLRSFSLSLLSFFIGDGRLAPAWARWRGRRRPGRLWSGCRRDLASADSGEMGRGPSGDDSGENGDAACPNSCRLWPVGFEIGLGATVAGGRSAREPDRVEPGSARRPNEPLFGTRLGLKQEQARSSSPSPAQLSTLSYEGSGCSIFNLLNAASNYSISCLR